MISGNDGVCLFAGRTGQGGIGGASRGADEELVGRQVAAVVNFAPRQIGPFMSEVLVLGFPDAAGAVVLIAPTKTVPNGGKLF